MLYTFKSTKTQRKKIPLTIDIAGFNYLQEPVVRENSFHLFQWIYCVDGKGEVIVNGQKSILTPGQLILFYPNEPHSYRAITEEWHVHIIAFSGSYALDLLKTLNIRESGIYHINKAEIFEIYLKQILSIHSQMHDEKSNSAHQKINSDKYLIALSKICYDFLLDLSFSAQYVHSSASETYNETIKIIISYLEEHFSEPISLGELADLVHLSKCYISTLFKKEMQQTILQYLNELRIIHARMMLSEYPEKKAAEIGKLCGFENPSYFGETFKKIVGMTPNEYRMS